MSLSDTEEEITLGRPEMAKLMASPSIPPAGGSGWSQNTGTGFWLSHWLLISKVLTFSEPPLSYL